MYKIKTLSTILFISLHLHQAIGQQINKVKITILSTMLADTKGKGEWGFSALVECDSTRILFDTGKFPDIVYENAQALHVDLSNIPNLILSHNHLDHTGGAIYLRNKYQPKGSFSSVLLGPGFFKPKLLEGKNPMMSFDSAAYTQTGGAIRVVSSFTRIAPGIYITGPVPRVHPEENYPKTTLIRLANKTAVDIVWEDISMVIDTKEGLIVLSGCGHAGIVNTLEFVKKNLPNRKVYAAIGGFHLLDAHEQKLTWTAEQIKIAGIQYFIGAHCTGLNAVYSIRSVTGLPANRCIIGSVGTIFENDKGITTGWLK